MVLPFLMLAPFPLESALPFGPQPVMSAVDSHVSVNAGRAGPDSPPPFDFAVLPACAEGGSRGEPPQPDVSHIV